MNIVDSKYRGLGGSTWGFFIGFAAVTLFAPLSKFLALPPSQTALLLGISSLTGSLLRIPFAAWCDTTGGKKPMIVLLILASAGMIGIYLILGNEVERVRQMLPALLFFGALAGCGVATFSVGIGQTSYWFRKKEQGKALGIYAGVGNLAPGLFVFIITNFLLSENGIGVRNTYLLWTILLIAGTIFYAIFAKNAWYFQLKASGKSDEEARKIAVDKYKQEVFPTGTVLQSLKQSAGIWQTWILVFAYFLTFGGFLALTNWFRELFNNYHGMTLAQAGMWTSIYSVGASLVRVFSGSITDKFGGRLSTMVFIIITFAGALLIALTSSFSFHATGLLLMMVGMGGGNAGVFKMVPQFIPHAVGGAAGWVGGLGATGGFILPLVLALFLTEGGAADVGYTQGFYVFALLALIVFIATALLPKKAKEA